MREGTNVASVRDFQEPAFLSLVSMAKFEVTTLGSAEMQRNE
jgi:hypothetical protein